MTLQGPLSGQTLGGKYLLGELLGKGGFGAVYKAENQMLGRPQAIKVLLEEHFSDPKFRERFLREARTLAALDHANIVHVDELGLQDNLVYLVMPYISGGTLQEMLKARSGPLGLEEIGRYLEQICSALGYAHAQGVVHLDLKPSNLLIHQDGRLLLSDFGLAHLVEQGAVEGGTSLQFGSPLYMAPEHFDGKPEARSDLYAVGVILYQLLTGKHPFDAATPAAIMRKHLTEPPPPLRQARPDLPAHLESMMAVALAKQPEQRFQSAAALLVAFKQSVAGQAVGQPSGTLAGAFAPTQVAQPLAYDPTLVKPGTSGVPAGMLGPASGPMAPPRAPSLPPGQSVMGQMPWQPGGPVMLPPGYVLRPRPVPQSAALPREQVWTSSFMATFALAAVVGLAITLFGVLGIKTITVLIGTGDNAISVPEIDTTAVTQAFLLMQCILAALCIWGLRVASGGLIRIGCILQISSMAVNVVGSILLLAQGPSGNIILYSWLNLLGGIINVASLACLSYGLARWRSPIDAALLPVQIILPLLFGIVTVVFLPRHAYPLGYGIIEGILSMLFGAGVLLFLVRPDCWKQSPALVCCFSVGKGFALLLGFLLPLTFELLHIGSGELLFRLLNGVELGSFALVALGFLLLVQRERIQRHARQQAVPALVG